jgi:hypothetical protein
VACALAALLLFAACGGDDEAPTDSGPTGPFPTPEGETPTPEGQTPTPFVDVCEPNPDPGTADEVRIDAPAREEAVSNPVTVSGSITGPESKFRIWLYDPTGKAITGLTLEKTPDEARDFSEEILWDVIDPIGACLRVFELTPESLPVNVAQIPVVLGRIN